MTGQYPPKGVGPAAGRRNGAPLLQSGTLTRSTSRLRPPILTPRLTPRPHTIPHVYAGPHGFTGKTLPGPPPQCRSSAPIFHSSRFKIQTSKFQASLVSPLSRSFPNHSAPSRAAPEPIRTSKFFLLRFAARSARGRIVRRVVRRGLAESLKVTRQQLGLVGLQVRLLAHLSHPSPPFRIIVCGWIIKLMTAGTLRIIQIRSPPYFFRGEAAQVGWNRICR